MAQLDQAVFFDHDAERSVEALHRQQSNHVEAKFTFWLFEIYRSENDFYCGHSYIARYDERIRFNGKSNDRCAADRELEIRGTLARWVKWGL